MTCAMNRLVFPVLLLLGAGLGLTGAQQASHPLEITLKNDSERERQTQARLEALLAQYDLSPWFFTEKMIIDENDTPHSHPVLTIHTRHLGDDNALLTTFIHEQIHRSLSDWEERRLATRAAIEELKTLFPSVPDGYPYGGRDNRSTYLHLIVCRLELKALQSYIEERPARRTLFNQTHYRWIYSTVLSNVAGMIDEVIERHGLDHYPTLSD